ncbi:hypothetical protein KPSB59_4030017 [Klebsiella quasipneumoniae subsp. quasipneumoniae]|nr:hypothetical protein KPSB59_4030017 [Klebsiella quasipneumoniae subsp. quasipneumoniae]
MRISSAIIYRLPSLLWLGGMGKCIHQATPFATIHNVENPVTLSQHFHSKIASEITVREHSPEILLRLPLHYHYQETRYGYAQVLSVVTGYRPQRV